MRVLVACLLACNEPHSPEAELADAKQEVRAMFAAIASRDCAALGALLAKARDAETCGKLLHEWNDDLQVVLVDVPTAERDGRDRRAIIVRAAVTKHAAPSTILVRVTHEQGVWQLAL